MAGLLALLGLPLFALWGASALREPAALFRLDRAASALVGVGTVLILLALFGWLPFSPMRWNLDEMPLILRIPLVAGMALFVIGAGLMSIYQTREFWRRRDYFGVLAFVALWGFWI